MYHKKHLRSLEEGRGSPAVQVIGGCKLPGMGVLKLELRSSAEHSVALIAESSLCSENGLGILKQRMRVFELTFAPL